MEQNPYSPDAGAPAKKKGSKTLMIVLGVFGGLGLLLCGGCVIMMFVGWQVGSGAMGEAAKSQLVGNVQVEDALGEIQECKINLMKSAAKKQEMQTTDNILVIEVTGSKGTGELVARQDPSNPQQMLQLIELTTSDGTTIDLSAASEVELQLN